jgi:dUTPase
VTQADRLMMVCIVKQGDRIAQLVLEQIFTPPVVEVKVKTSALRYKIVIVPMY